MIRRDLNEIAAVCRAEKKQNNETRALAASLQKGEVSTGWKRYTVPREVTVMDWIVDLNERLKQLIRFGASDNSRRETFWLGGPFSPEAYITATRQQVAQANTWSLDQLNLHIHIGRTDNTDVFRISGIDIRGAKSSGANRPVRIVWSCVNSLRANATSSSLAGNRKRLMEHVFH